MSKQKFIHQELIDVCDAYYERIVMNSMPETEEEFWYTIEFLGFNIMWDSMAKASNFHDEMSKEQKSARIKLMIVEHNLMFKLANLVSVACAKFKLTRSVFVEHPEENTFQKWFIEKSQEYDCEIKYSLLLFDDVYAVDNPQYPV